MEQKEVENKRINSKGMEHKKSMNIIVRIFWAILSLFREVSLDLKIEASMLGDMKKETLKTAYSSSGRMWHPCVNWYNFHDWRVVKRPRLKNFCQIYRSGDVDHIEQCSRCGHIRTLCNPDPVGNTTYYGKIYYFTAKEDKEEPEFEWVQGRMIEEFQKYYQGYHHEPDAWNRSLAIMPVCVGKWLEELERDEREYWGITDDDII